jgi:hypothetical protein
MTKSGRPFCVVRDQGILASGIQVNPLLYDVLKKVSDERLTCTVELHFTDGSLGNSHIRMDGERLVKVLEPAATLQAG